MRVELAMQRTLCRRGFELPLRQTSNRVRRTRRQREVRGFRDQYLGRAQAFEFRRERGGLDLGRAKPSGGEREPRNADGILFLPHCQQQVVALVVEQRRIGKRARRDDAQDFAFDRAFRCGRIADLLADCDRFAEFDQLRQVLLDRVVGHARHLDRLAVRRAAGSEGDVEQARGFFRIAEKELVKIPHAVKHQHVGVLRLDA